MKHDFWLRKWADRQIGFHRSDANPALVEHFGDLSLPPASRIFVPLCGKTRDIAWLLDRGHHVVGVELARQAVDELFDELGVRPEETVADELVTLSASNIRILVGDFFMLSRGILGPVDAVYDRAALVALPRAMRERYAAHLETITGAAPQLLLSFEYEQSTMDGPPFSVPPDEVAGHYGDRYEITLLSRKDFVLKETCPARESVWMLVPKS